MTERERLVLYFEQRARTANVLKKYHQHMCEKGFNKESNAWEAVWREGREDAFGEIVRKLKEGSDDTDNRIESSEDVSHE